MTSDHEARVGDLVLLPPGPYGAPCGVVVSITGDIDLESARMQTLYHVCPTPEGGEYLYCHTIRHPRVLECGRLDLLECYMVSSSLQGGYRPVEMLAWIERSAVARGYVLRLDPDEPTYYRSEHVIALQYMCRAIESRLAAEAALTEILTT